jgi:hypothetical protein
MSNKRHMQFTLQGGAPLDMEDLAQQLREGVPVVYGGQEVGRTHNATPQPNALQVVIELTTPAALPLIKGIHLRAVPKDRSAKLGSSLTVHAVEAKTEES